MWHSVCDSFNPYNTSKAEEKVFDLEDIKNQIAERQKNLERLEKIVHTKKGKLSDKALKKIIDFFERI